MYAVVAQRQVAGQHEAGLADPAPVQIERRGEVIHLPHPAPHGAVLELQPHLGGCTVGHMHPEPRRRTGARDDRGGHMTRPIRPRMRGQSRIAVLLGAGGHAEGGKHGHQRRLGDQHLPAGPVRIPRGDAESPGKFDQRGRELSHAAHLASGIRPAPTRATCRRATRNPGNPARLGRPFGLFGLAEMIFAAQRSMSWAPKWAFGTTTRPSAATMPSEGTTNPVGIGRGTWEVAAQCCRPR